MEYFAGIDVSLDSVSVCVVDGTGKVLREAKVVSEPGGLVAWFRGLGIMLERIGMEAGPLSQWLHAGMREEGLAVELLETRHVRTAFKTMPVKTDGVDGPRRHHRAKAAAVAQSQGGHPMQISTVGIDLAKRVFQIHGVDQDGNVVLRKQLRRAQVLGFFAKLPPCLL
jgi:transposase